MLKLLTVALSIALLSGCATPKTMQATGGSKSDGTVDMSFDFSPFEDPQVDMMEAKRLATERCEAWGYTSAEAFGGAMSQCVSQGSGMCNLTRVTYTYQCLD